MTDEKGRPMTYWGGSPAAPEPPERVATLRELIAEIKQPLWRLAANARLDELERSESLAQTEIKGHMRVAKEVRVDALEEAANACERHLYGTEEFHHGVRTCIEAIVALKREPNAAGGASDD